MDILTGLLESLPDGEIVDARIGLHWTCVTVSVDGVERCGLASTLEAPHEHGGPPAVPQAGRLVPFSALDMAGWIRSDVPTQRSLGTAALNALISPPPEAAWVEGNAEHVIARYGAGKRVAVVGHFPFIPRLREVVGELNVLELIPKEGDLPAEAAPEILPQMDVAAITGMTLINHTFQDLLSYCPEECLVMVLGPSTPLSPVFFEHGVDMLSGSLVEQIDPVRTAVSQGGSFRQIHRFGVRLITMVNPASRFQLG